MADVDNYLCVYQHKRLDTGEVFYVGKGSITRSFDQRSRNAHWRAIVKKCGYSVEIVCDMLDERHAFSLEVMLIQAYGRRDIGTGPLVNMTDGGDGIRGRIMPPVSAETRAKLREANRGRKKSAEHVAKIVAARRGWKPSDEHAAKVSAALKGRPQADGHVEKRVSAIRGENSPMWGKSLPQETRAKISAARKGRALPAQWAANIANGKRGRSRTGSTSSFCGVGACGSKWRAGISPPHGKRIYLGLHSTEEGAARAYDRAAVEMYGASARLNFPEAALYEQ